VYIGIHASNGIRIRTRTRTRVYWHTRTGSNGIRSCRGLTAKPVYEFAWSFDKAAAFQSLVQVGANYEVIVVRVALGLLEGRWSYDLKSIQQLAITDLVNVYLQTNKREIRRLHDLVNRCVETNKGDVNWLKEFRINYLQIYLCLQIYLRGGANFLDSGNIGPCAKSYNCT